MNTVKNTVLGFRADDGKSTAGRFVMFVKFGSSSHLSAVAKDSARLRARAGGLA